MGARVRCRLGDRVAVGAAGGVAAVDAEAHRRVLRPPDHVDAVGAGPGLDLARRRRRRARQDLDQVGELGAEAPGGDGDDREELEVALLLGHLRRRQLAQRQPQEHPVAADRRLQLGALDALLERGHDGELAGIDLDAVLGADLGPRLRPAEEQRRGGRRALALRGRQLGGRLAGCRLLFALLALGRRRLSGRLMRHSSTASSPGSGCPPMVTAG